jgi:nucleotide-binding universal stress UspA family protein
LWLVLACFKPTENAMERIVAAVDGSAPSGRAVDLAADLAGKYDAELILFAAVREISLVVDAELDAYARLENICAPLAELGGAAGETALADARLRAAAKGAAWISIHSASGDPAEEIIGLAKSRQADLIVIGSRGHDRLAGLLLGRVAQKVVAHAACPHRAVRRGSRPTASLPQPPNSRRLQC